MKKINKKFIPILVLSVMILNLFLFGNKVSMAANTKHFYSRDFNLTESYLTSQEIKNGHKVKSLKITKKDTQRKFHYQLKETKSITETKTVTLPQKATLKETFNAANQYAKNINSTGKYGNYTKASAVLISSDKNNWPIKITYTKKETKLVQKATSWTSAKNLGEVIGASTAKNATNITEEYQYVYHYDVVYENEGQQPTTTQTNDTSGVVNQKPGSVTNTVNNGTATENAIKFVNQVYQITNANKDTLAVKDLVEKKKSATDIVAIVLTEIYSNDTLTLEEFNNEAYKRALGREPSSDEKEAVKSDGVQFSDIINIVVLNDEFKKECEDLSLEVGTYSPVTFNVGTTKEKASEYVKKQYLAVLDREPSESELDLMATNLVNGKITATSVVVAMFHSAEFKNKQLDDGQYMQKLAKAINLGRDLSEKELNEYKQRLTNGENRNVLLKELLLHSQFRALSESYGLSMGSYAPGKITITTELAKSFIANVSNPILKSGEQTNEKTAELLTSGELTGAEFIYQFVDSYYKKRVESEKISNDEYVNNVFKAALQRAPSSSELSDYLSKLDSNNKSKILVEMLNSKEFISLSNTYYLPYTKFTGENETEKEIVQSKSAGAIVEFNKTTDSNGNVTTTVKSVKFDTSSGVKGDVNGDNQVNSSDASLVLMYSAIQAVRRVETTDEDLKVGDVNGDNNINASDAALILMYSAKCGVGKDVKWEDIVKEAIE